MLSSESITIFHKKLQDIFSSSLVLLGGSYLYGEAGEKSDVDFYVISSLRVFFQRKNFLDAVRALKEDHPELKITFMPRFFFTRGWYYVYGRDLDGNFHSSKINRKIIFRNSLKLAYFHYAQSVLVNTPAEKQKSIFKSAQQLSLAVYAGSGLEMKSPLFLAANLKEGLATLSAERRVLLTDILDHKLAPDWWRDKNLSEMGRAIFNTIIFVYNTEASKWLGFLPANYLLYNARFLKKGNYKFLFRNPDKYLLKKMFNCLTSPACDVRGLAGQLRETVFPIYIV